MARRLRWRGGRRKEPCPRRIRRFVEPALLLLLHINATHGYDLMEGLQRLGFEDYPVDSSAIYRTLRQLEAAGMVTSEWDTDSTAGPPRRVYYLTEASHHYLAAWVEDLRVTDRILHKFLEAYDAHMNEGEGEHHQLLRAERGQHI
jgi:PadR family transcriptional regulator PadR